MKQFLTFLAEANSVGSKFEQKTADMMNKWLKVNKLQKKFDVRRFQSVFESDTPRDEEYSDVVVTNLETDEKFFVECKEADRSNVMNTQFDILESGDIKAVRGNRREQIDEDEFVGPFVDAIRKNAEYRKFIEFLNTKNKLIQARPSEFYFGKCEEPDGVLKELIGKYNKMVKSGGVEKDCKPFDAGKLRDSTKNMLVCALCWRLSDPGSRTWDIFHISDIPNFGDMIRNHYSKGKKIPARYIQFNDKLFQTGKQNPFGLADVPRFPRDIQGKFALKFTPRFGTGSVYVTPRSEITTKLASDYSFNDKKKWPKT